jgi:hypothetical protein
MSGMIRLAFFVAVSAGLHALVLLDMVSHPGIRGPGPVRTTVVPIVETAAPEEAKPIPRNPPATASPVAPAEPAPAAAEPEATPLPRLTRRAEQEGLDLGRPPPTPPGAAEPTPPPRPDEGRVQTPFKTPEEYLAHVGRLADRAPRDGVAVPDLITDDGLDFREVSDLLRFFGCKVVAYPQPRDGQPTYYLELTGEALDTVVRREGAQSLAGYSNRARDLTGHQAFWDLLARVAARHHLDPYHACIAAVVPERIDRYFLYKQQRAAARAGLAPDAVRATRGRFRRTNVGWMLEIYAVEPMTGGTVPVTSAPAEEWRG